uniref:Potassium calcium-activated channel subfamily M regulatory beta subunit 2 n=1 Tax=Homo sapiens TaxID=9606 RepID=F8WE19_HUMAN
MFIWTSGRTSSSYRHDEKSRDGVSPC